MAYNNFFGIKFPFRNVSGQYLELTTTEKDSVKSNLLHLIITKKGSRLYNPNFGTNIMDYLFNPLGQDTFDAIQTELINSVEMNMKGIKIDTIKVNQFEKTVNLVVNYSYTDGVFLVKDILDINF